MTAGAAGALEQRVRSVPGVVACTVDDAAVVHVLLGFGARPERVAAAVSAVVGEERTVRIAGGPPAERPRRLWAVAGDLVPVFGAVLAATALAAGGSWVMGAALGSGSRPPAAPVVASQRPVAAADVRTARPAPVVEERSEVLGEVVEAPPAP